MRRGAAVRVFLQLAAPSGERHKANAQALAADLPAHEPLVVVLGLERSGPRAVLTLHVHAEVLQHGAREGERRVVVAQPLE